MNLVRILPRPLAIALLAYAFGMGATYNGLLTPDIRWMTLVILAALLAIWVAIRWQFRWRWTGSALDIGLALGAAAIGLSLLANTEDWRRISIGIWYLTLYGMLWYLLHDLIAYNWIKRSQVADALLAAGGLIIALGWLQSREWLGSLLLVFQGGEALPLPRPVSTLGNPNTLAAMLVVLVPLGAAYALTSRGIARLVTAFYALAGLLLLILTYSRGGWIGTAAGLALLGAIALVQVDFRAWWARASVLRRLGAGSLGVAAVGGAVGLALVLVRSLDEGGRSLGLRTFIYETAVRLFQETPLFGSGLFTFGGGLARLNSTPPTEPHSHAHNLLLHMGAELGIVGLIALVTLSILAALAARRLLRGPRPSGLHEQRQRTAQIGGCAAVFGAAVHHLLDLPAMNPAVALSILVALVLATAPSARVELRTAINPSGRSITLGLAVAATALIVSGVWSTAVYDPYYRAIGLAGWFVDDRARTEEALDVVIQAQAADPSLPVFASQVGMISARLDDLPTAIAAYERFVALAPEYAFGWANLATLRDANDNPERALASWLEAATRADRDPWFVYQLGEAAEETGLINEAYAAYARSLNNDPDIQLLPGWDESPIRRRLPLPPLSDLAQTTLGVVLGSDDAEALYADSVRGVDAVVQRVLSGILYARAGQPEQASAELDVARRLALTAGERAWIAIGEHHLALAAGDAQAAAAALQTAADELELTLNDADTYMLQNIHYIQYLTYALPRQMVPQMAYPSAGFVILHVLDQLTTTAEGGA